MAVSFPVTAAPGVRTSNPLPLAAAGLADDEPLRSRRVNAAAVQASGAAAGAPPSEPPDSHDNSVPLNPDTAPGADAVVITGAAAAGPGVPVAAIATAATADGFTLTTGPPATTAAAGAGD